MSELAPLSDVQRIVAHLLQGTAGHVEFTVAGDDGKLHKVRIECSLIEQTTEAQHKKADLDNRRPSFYTGTVSTPTVLSGDDFEYGL